MTYLDLEALHSTHRPDTSPLARARVGAVRTMWIAIRVVSATGRKDSDAELPGVTGGLRDFTAIWPRPVVQANEGDHHDASLWAHEDRTA
jgi:hypothetical protein